ncbi:TIGR03617 family F420-dependent LLM class oxidoreductase [Steroidobacter denitrificans]|uniref:TIGR03617 family F420-dependent LLM class oxidoreductase n=1 Tax=Steroidobacter denitrificans TaxID=465721 RepID=UPI00082FC997|nr:TIGR03617 family F420-dependent LLM class oxidoreductase [Steroidobacter denitrificans]
MRVETALQGAFDAGGPIHRKLDDLARTARFIEEAGFDGCTAAEVGHDPFLPLLVGIEHTTRLTFCPNVAVAFPRSPFVTAQIAWDLQQFSAGRFHLGLGSQVKANNVRRYSTAWPGPPGPRMREYILCLRAILQSFNADKPTFFEGEHYQFTMLQPMFNPYVHHGPSEHPHIPIYIAAVNPYMARLAGELADGIRPPGWVTAKYFKQVLLPAIESGCKSAGRTLADIDLVGGGVTLTGKDAAEIEAKKKTMREFIAFFGSTRSYHGVFAVHGWEDLGLRLHQMSLEGNHWEKMGELITDDMIEEFAIVATYDELVPKLKAQWDGLCTTLSLPYHLPVPQEQLQSMVAELQGRTV